MTSENAIHRNFDSFNELPSSLFLLYFKNISGTWSLRPHIFIHKQDAEYIANFYDRETYIVPVTVNEPKLFKRTVVKKVRKPKVRKVRKPKGA